MGYLARYFHRQFEREGQRGVTIAQQHAKARTFRPASAPRYHFT